MSDDNKPQFVQGMFADEPSEQVIGFIKTNLAFDLKRFRQFCDQWEEQNPDKKYMRVAVKVGKETGKWYAAIDPYEPKGDKEKKNPWRD
tara:strand:+ start:589 stop:855 length:267 start_codon:yes stop_codon:yes gene_type:complete